MNKDILNRIIITSPSLDTQENVSGVSSVVRFIIDNNDKTQYLHFSIGKKDSEKGGIVRRCVRIFRTYKEWKEYLAEEPQAIIHYSFPLDAKSVIRDFFFMRYALRQKRRMLVHIHGGLYLTKKKRPWFINRMMRKIFSWNLPFIVLSNTEKKILTSDFGAGHVEILPNCVELKDAVSYTRKRKNENEPLVIGYLGRIEENKGMDWLLLACNILVRDRVPFRLLLAGRDENSYVDKFSDYVGSSFDYVGVVSGEKKSGFLHSLDIFVLPSYFEGMPMALLECMSYGVVPLTTPVGSIPEVVTDGDNGILIKVKDEASIVNAVKRLDADREELCKMSVEAKNTILKHFSPEQYIEKLNGFYDVI